VDVQREGQTQTSLKFSLEYDKKYNRVRCTTLLPGDRAAVGSEFGLFLFDTRTGQQLCKYLGHTGIVWAVSPSREGQYLLSAAHDMTLRIWDPDQELPLLSLFFASDDWIAWTPEGYYAASPGGERLMGWHVNQGPDKLANFMPACQFSATFHRPDVIKLLLETSSVERALAAADQARGKVTDKTNVADVLPPKVVITSPPNAVVVSGERELEIKVVAEQVGPHPITSVQLLLDRHLYKGQAGVKHFDTPQRAVSHQFIVSLTPGVKHTIQVRADSAVSYGVSREIEVISKKENVAR